MSRLLIRCDLQDRPGCSGHPAPVLRYSRRRLAACGIDAPELDHPWGQRSKWALVQLCMGQTVTARIKPELSYNRMVAECFLPDGRDLGAELVHSGLY